MEGKEYFVQDVDIMHFLFNVYLFHLIPLTLSVMFASILWNPDIMAFKAGPLEVRWYALFWCIGLALAYIVVYKLYRRQQIP